MAPGNIAFPFDEYHHLFNKLKNPAYKILFERWLNEFGFIFNKKEAVPLYLQKRLPQMERAADELRVFFETQ